MEQRHSNRPSLFAASGFYLLAAVGLWLTSLFSADIAAGLARVWPGITVQQTNLVVNVLYYVPFLLIPVLLWSQGHGGTETLRLNPIRFGATVRVVLVAVLSVSVVQGISILWMALWQKLGLNVFVENYVRPGNTAELTRSIVAGAMLAPICEELLFRGVMFPAWEARGTRRAIAATALLFAMLHGSLLGLPGEFFGGVLLALLVFWTDSLYAGLIFHSVYNAASMMLNYISSGAEVEAAADVALMQTDLIGYLGGASSVMLMLGETVLMLALIAALMRGFRIGAAMRKVALETVSQDDEGRRKVRVLTPEEYYSRVLKDDGFAPHSRTPMSAGCMLVLMAGVVSSLAMYLLDVLSMRGG